MSKLIQNNDGKTHAIDVPAKKPASALHAMLGITPDQVRADLIKNGESPEAILRDFDRMERALRDQLLPKQKKDAGIAAPAPKFDARDFDLTNIMEGLALFDERVTAGIPTIDIDDPRSRPATLTDLFGKQDWDHIMIAIVSGWSMRDASILDGDKVLVNFKIEPKDGDIVLAHLVGHGHLVKRLRILGANKAMLESANPDFEPIIVDDPSLLTIHGVVRGRIGRI